MLGLTPRAAAEPALEAVVSDAAGVAFRISEEEPQVVAGEGAGRRVASGFLRIGAQFRGWTLTRYERESETLHVTTTAGATRALRLKAAKVAAATESPAADPELRKAHGLPLARALAARGDARMAAKLQALVDAQKTAYLTKANLQGISTRLAEVRTRNAAGTAAPTDRSAIDYLEKMEVQMQQSHAKLEIAILRLQAKIAGDADFAVHGTPPPPLPPLPPGEEEPPLEPKK